MELIILGTGNAMATKCYNTCFALRNGQEYFLVDAGGGNGILRQLENARIPCENIHHIFVTHGHTDHVLGVVWVIRKIAMLMESQRYSGMAFVYCHDVLVEMLDTFCRMLLPAKLLKFVGDGIRLVEVQEGDSIRALDMDVSFFDIRSTKAKQFGFRAILPDGKKLVCLGDEPYNEANKPYVEGADWLLSEAFCLFEDRENFKPYEKHHSTALDAGRLAQSLGAKRLILYHTEDTNLSQRKQRYADEAGSVYDGEIWVPEDLERIRL